MMQVYLACVFGIIISVVLPILRVGLPKAAGGFTEVGKAAWPYAATGLFSALAAIVLIAGAGTAVVQWTWQDAFIAGYAWDSTLQKFVKA